LAERWNATSWTIQSTPNPAGGTDTRLSGVSCTAVNACIAVGNPGVVAERWNGTSWTIQSTPTTAGAHSSGLQAVSCTAVNACVAVGSYQNSAGRKRDVGGTLERDELGDPEHPQPDRGLQPRTGRGVVQRSERAHRGRRLRDQRRGRQDVGGALERNGLGDPEHRNPAGTFFNELDGVSCPAANACTAVGTDESGSALAEHWNGTSWGIQSTPVPAGAANTGLGGVSCTTASACIAVGAYDQSTTGPSLTLAVRYTGGAS
jgi:hypothetical protein